MKRELKFVAVGSVLFAFTAAVFSVIQNKYQGEAWYVPAGVTALGSLLITLLALVWQLRREVAEFHQLHDDRRQQIDRVLDEAKSSRESIHSEVSAVRNTVSALGDTISSEMEVARNLVELLSRDTQGVTRTRMSLSKRTDVVQKMGHRTLEEFHRIFRATTAGYTVYGEHQSLVAYSIFWQELARLQRSINKLHGGSDAHRLIARVTHSNDVELWMPDHHQIAQDLLDCQKNFADDGGRIVRLFVSPARQADEKYQHTIDQMAAYGVEARFLHYGLKYDYDFIWVSNAQHNIVLTWHSGQNGRGLSRCEVADRAEGNIRRMWRQFGKISEDKDGRFKSIPDSRRLSDLDVDS